MAKLLAKLRIFVASPSDCTAERTTIRRLVESDPSIQTLAKNLDVLLDAYGWEDVFPDIGRPQSLINEAILKYDPNWFIFMFWHRFGSDAGHGTTGTQEEWNNALQQKQQRGGDLSISIYFNKALAQPYEIDGRQLEKLKTFRENLSKEHSALAAEFNGTHEFEETFRTHLTQKLFSASITHPREISRIPTRLLDASIGLLSWPTTLGNGKRIESQQLQTILQKIQNTDSSTTIILGPPGSGKSAFLATLSKRLCNHEIPLLSIKADQLRATVESLEDLRGFLDLPISPRDALATQSMNEKVVLIIDQLDAVSELLDRKSGRLNVLLNLVHSLSGRHNIHIIASSREFEFRHDVRLSSIEAERLDLETPKWQQVSEILSQVGIRPETIRESLKNLLLLPLNLKVFLDLSATTATFDSHHALLEELWKQRVVSPSDVENRDLLLQLLAKRMSSEETLWLPIAIADSYPAARQALEQSDILTRAQSGLTIGFRHQTYYDFTNARAFEQGARSLSKDVLDRQDGLFVRPSLISGLNYLRAAARSQYHKELAVLMRSPLRLHLRTLIIELLGEQSDPDDLETQLMLPLLASEDEGPRVLRSVANSMGWFARLKQHPVFIRWLGMSPDKAAHCVPLLNSAIRHHPDTCVELIERFWIGNEAYDSLSLVVFREKTDWDHHDVELVCRIARRTQLQWIIEYLAERVAESAPAEAPLMIRADFDRQLEKALKELEQPVPELPPDADRQQRLMHELTYQGSRPIRRIIEDSQTWDNLEEFAVRAPKAFLDQLWPWFLNVVTQMAEDEHEFVVGYRHDPTSYTSFEGDLEPAPIVRALLTAIIDLATKDKDGFLEFLRKNISVEFLIIHRLLSRGLEALASQDPQAGLEYLSGDPRRLIVGDMHDQQGDTKRLIRAISSHLDANGINELEKIVLAYSKYKRTLPEWSAKDKFDRRQWSRQERLELLRAIPLELLSVNTKRLRSEEELVFPEPHSPEQRDTGGLLGVVGSRMTVEEMAHASDENLLRLFDELPDSVGWDNPRRTWSRDMSRAGGAIQLSREFGELAKRAPNRVFALISHLQPRVHEQYAGEAIRGLTSTELPPTAIIDLIEELDNRGFRSREFRDDVSSAAEALAGRTKGLPDTFLQRLVVWLAEEPEPVWPETPIGQTRSDDKERTSSILYGHGMTFSLTHGRGSITRAIAEGYSKRDPPDIEGWGGVIESRLTNEKHPKLWSEILTRMPVLFQGDHGHATSLFDKVIRACPDVLGYPFALNAIAHVLRGLDPKEIGETWLESLLVNGSSFCRQAYGELLPLFNCFHQDVSSTKRLMRQLEGDRNSDINRGLAYAATHLWTSRRCREIATRILSILAASDDESVQRAVASVFQLTRDYFELDTNMRLVIDKVASNPPVLLLAAADLIEALEPFAGTEPKLVSRVCDKILKFGREQINKPGTSWIYVAATLTNIALTLHRQNAYREAGLQLFEQLIALNVREATDAIELLDRRPIVNTDNQRRPRWRRRVRKNR
jgi:adenylate kinase family enzyme